MAGIVNDECRHLASRVRIEERALAGASGGGFDDYARTSKRIVPWIY